jgi:photosystem II stability/assembly factor-like uncharacterized protein
MSQRKALSKPAEIQADTPDPLVKWRVVTWMYVERSGDGGKTWLKTSPPPAVSPDSSPAVTITAITAVDALNARVITSDGRTFSTTDGGVTWTQVQGNPAAPF